jgi:hypothetical protein
MRVVLTARSDDVRADAAAAVPDRLVHAVVRHGADLVLYTDDPREVVQSLVLDGAQQVRIEPTTLEDVFLHVTSANGTHEPAATA